MTETLALSWLVVRRNWIVYKRDFLANISPTLADPLFFIFSLGLGLGAFIPEVEGRSYLAFLAPGLCMSTAMMTSFFECSYGFYVRLTYENVYKAMLTTRVGPVEVILGEFMWVALKGAVMSLGVGCVFAAFGAVTDLRLLPLVAWGGALLAVSLGAIGLLASALCRDINQFQTVYAFVVAPLFFFSGIFFPLHRTPAFAKFVALLLPLSHGVRLAQGVFWAQDVGRTVLVESAVMAVQALVLGALAWRAIARKLSS